MKSRDWTDLRKVDNLDLDRGFKEDLRGTIFTQRLVRAWNTLPMSDGSKSPDSIYEMPEHAL